MNQHNTHNQQFLLQQAAAPSTGTCKIERRNRWGQWEDDWAGDPSDNVFRSEAEAWEMLPIIVKSFHDWPDDADEYTPEYRVVENT